MQEQRNDALKLARNRRTTGYGQRRGTDHFTSDQHPSRLWFAVRWPFMVIYLGAWALWLNLRTRDEAL